LACRVNDRIEVHNLKGYNLLTAKGKKLAGEMSATFGSLFYLDQIFGDYKLWR
jgi:hypothetical protein